MKKFIALLLALTAFALTACKASPRPHMHSYGNWTEDTPASCKAEGRQMRQCICGDTQYEALPKLTHSYTETVTKNASCGGAGEKTFTCPGCQDSYTEEIPSVTYTSTQLYDLYLGSVGLVQVKNKSDQVISLGTGFVYSADGSILTNYHVIKGGHSATVTLADKEYKVEQVLAYDVNIDLAVLKINATDLMPAVICAKEHAVGSVVYAFGNSQGLTSTFSDGMITYSNREQEGVQYVQHDAPISNGNSGGPLINIYGEVIGINTLTYRDSQNLNFAIHISELEKLDYSKPMTMAEVYAEESNSFEIMRDYLMEKGKYDSEDKDYSMTLKKDYVGDVYCTWLAYYDTEDDEICIMVYTNNDVDCWASLDLDNKLSGRYFWMCNMEDSYVAGYMESAYFRSDTVLPYGTTNTSESTAKELAELGSLMVATIVNTIDDVFGPEGVVLADIGFRRF